ncbi:hypothetical protein RND81_04G152600 [Saponaria officinalis]|uniref:Uncharacterized protein n=1 Tax=Saponaria officinalis TaxID=3572 RepID=A0AAW1LED9_SAPOF
MENNKNWSEKVEDLIELGETDAAITLLETLISELETLISPNSQSQLVSALLQLSNLYFSKGLSLKSDQLSSRASAIKLRSLSSTGFCSEKDVSEVSECGDFRCGSSSSTRNDEFNHHVDVDSVAKPSIVAPKESSDDDWEAMVDRAPDELISVSPRNPPEPDLSKLSLSDTKPKIPKRRGRGTFTYRKQGLYSDQQVDDCSGDESPNEDAHDECEKVPEAKNSIYGTRHVLVLDGFDPRTTTTDLEKLYEDFRERGFAIRWVNDTLALAVFRTPSVAREALDSVRCSFPVRVMEEDDLIISSVSLKDLDPPRQRPKTSARTAQRLIAQELGVKLPSNFGSRELRNQEDARRNRIVTRQILRDEAWGPDDTK